MSNKKSNNSGKLSTSDVFGVPESTKHLETKALNSLESAYRSWRNEASRADHLRSRSRVFCVFLLLRHSGAKLGEILKIDERKSINFEHSTISLGTKGHSRDVPLPRGVCRELKALLEGPMGAGLEGKIFNFDPGYIRRIFYERAESCDLPRELGSPSVLRRSRAVELLRNGVPLGVVRKVLGQTATDLAAVYQDWSEGDVRNIVRRLALEESSLKTSARNTFIGHVTQIRRDGILADVEFETPEGICISSVITLESLYKLELEIGAPVSATIKAPLVAVHPKTGDSSSSARNCILAKVTEIKRTEILTEVSGETESGTRICALVTSWSIDEDGTNEGDTVEFSFKAMSIVLHVV